MTGTADGFTLIEALVAMAVLAVAATGFVRATEGHIDTIAALEARAAAGWVADDRLVEARADLPAAPAAMLGRDWHATIASRPSDDPDIAKVSVTVELAGVRTLLRGFRETAPVDASPGPGDGTPAAANTVAARVAAVEAR